MAETVIDIQHLTKFYGRHLGIDDVSFSVDEGEVFGFIGPNGAGKSTTIRLLLALIFPTGGSATIFGKDCIKQAPEIAREVGYLPSEVSYYEGMKVIDLLKYAASFYHKDCLPRIHELAERLELDLNRRIDDLSYGNRKKVGIIQGLAHSPRLIILDEPTGGLDPLMQRTFFDLLREENQKGVTIFFSSHILSEVQRLCDRVAILKDGRLINLQKMSELQKDRYKKVRLVSADPGIDAALEGIVGKGAINLEVDGDTASFMFRGDLNGMVSVLERLDLKDLSIEEPSLEEIFIHYYR
jgi:ABC-2 type transport system ATP-binding protein